MITCLWWKQAVLHKCSKPRGSLLKPSDLSHFIEIYKEGEVMYIIQHINWMVFKSISQHFVMHFQHKDDVMYLAQIRNSVWLNQKQGNRRFSPSSVNPSPDSFWTSHRDGRHTRFTILTHMTSFKSSPNSKMLSKIPELIVISCWTPSFISIARTVLSPLYFSFIFRIPVFPENVSLYH